jgi:hypothetical protein
MRVHFEHITDHRSVYLTAVEKEMLGNQCAARFMQVQKRTLRSKYDLAANNCLRAHVIIGWLVLANRVLT